MGVPTVLSLGVAALGETGEVLPQWVGGLPGMSVSPWAGSIHSIVPVLLPAHVAHQGAEQVCLNASMKVNSFI